MVRQNVKAPVVFVDGTCRDVGMQSYDACYAKTHSCWLIFMSREKEGETANEKLYPGQEKEKGPETTFLKGIVNEDVASQYFASDSDSTFADTFFRSSSAIVRTNLQLAAIVRRRSPALN